MKDFDVFTITGEEPFTDGGQNLGLNVLDFWRYEFSNIYDLQDEISEYIVSAALGLEKGIPFNKVYWTRWDINYPHDGHDIKVEVKATAYFHSWQTEKSKISENRTFGITKSNSSYDEEAKVASGEIDHVSGENVLERPSDVYVFCVNTGKNRTDAFPLEMKNWQFYILSTKYIDRTFGDQKSVTLNRLQNLGIHPVSYSEIRYTVDRIADGEIETS